METILIQKHLIQTFVSSEFYGDYLITEKIGLLSEMGVTVEATRIGSGKIL